jgi:hypothetical protein
MSVRIRVTTRAKCFEQRKREHLEQGYRIEDEQPMPINGMCSFVAVKETSAVDPMDLVVQAVNRKRDA